MSEGRIVVEYTSVQKGVPETTAVPLITVKKRIDRQYVITGALDPRTAERVDVSEALKRGLIDPQTGEFVNDEKGGLRTPEREAVEDGWILAHFDNSSPTYESETFAVVAVYDDRFNYYTSFMQAVRKGLLDPGTGNYISSKSGKRIYAADAMKRGLIKAQKCPNNITETEIFKSALKSFKDSKRLELLSPSLSSTGVQQVNQPTCVDVAPSTSVVTNGNISDPPTPPLDTPPPLKHIDNHVTSPHFPTYSKKTEQSIL